MCVFCLITDLLLKELKIQEKIMAADSIKNIFRLYAHGKHFSQRGKRLFGKWLLAPDHKEAKEHQIEFLWEESSCQITQETHVDWIRLQRQLHPLKPQKHSLHWYQTTAAVILLTISMGSIYWLTRQHFQQDMPQLVELFAPYGENFDIFLPDSTEVQLNSGSLLVYPQHFDHCGTRTVYLTGEATFRVKKDPQKPFIVKTAGVDVQALGTVFTIKAYPSETFSKTTLEEGSVLVSMKNPQHESVILQPNEQLCYSYTKQTGIVSCIDISLFKMARSGYLIFEQATFSEIADALERRFGVNFQYDTTHHSTGLYNLKFLPNESLESILDILRHLTGFRYKIQDNNVIIN